MTEASVSAPFMKGLREELLICKVIKHHDASMIGLVDCSVTFQQRVWWLEFKFYEFKKKWGMMTAAQIVVDILAEARTATAQAQMLRDFSVCAAGAYYVIWIKKSGGYIVHPVTGAWWFFESTPDAIAGMLEIIRGTMVL